MPKKKKRDKNSRLVKLNQTKNKKTKIKRELLACSRRRRRG